LEVQLKVFISWSGDESHDAAIALRDWLPSVIQAVDPFVSSEDIERGSRWFSEIGKELEAVNFGILCITPQNMEAPWILFEAGALSKSLGQSRVTPLLIGIRNADLKGPLSQFNTTSIEKSDVLKLVKTINNHLKENALPETKLEKAFEKWWPDLDKPLSGVNKRATENKSVSESPSRDQGEILEEILELTRSIARQTSKQQLNEEWQRLAYILISRIKDRTTYPKWEPATADAWKALKGKEYTPSGLVERINELLDGSEDMDKVREVLNEIKTEHDLKDFIKSK
jgi:hypothetical protein